MELISILSDIFGASGMMFFLTAEILQLRKILRKKSVRSLSYHTYKSKLTAIIFTLCCFGLAALWLSFIAVFAELLVVIYIIKLMRKYRGH